MSRPTLKRVIPTIATNATNNLLSGVTAHNFLIYDARRSVIWRPPYIEMLPQTAWLIAVFAPTVLGTKILLTNDDGWAVSIIRAQFEALTLSGHDVRSFLFLQY